MTVTFGVMQPAQNVNFIGAYGGRLGQVNAGPKSVQPLQASHLARSAIWTYTQVQPGPVRGPQPRLARGSGKTGTSALPGNAPNLPGYLSENTYQPVGFTYDPVNQPDWLKRIPKTIMTGENGRALVGTYQPHDFVVGVRNLNHMRQAANWQVQEYLPEPRDLIARQQVMKYRNQSYTSSARPLSANDYFLGYQINPDISARIGQSTLGQLGSF